MTAVDRGDGVSAWRQIVDQLTADIGQGRFSPGDQLPIETKLAAQFDVNRHTVRRALAELAGKGLVHASAGRGTFVADKLAYAIGARTRFSEIVSRAGREAGGALLGATDTLADRRVADALGIPEGATVIRLDTLRLADNIPISMGVSYFPLPRFKRIGAAYEKLGSTTKALKRCGVRDYRRAETRISARTAASDEARQLGLTGNRLVLTVDSINVDLKEKPIQFTRALFAADRTELVVES
jgi:GntR family phosphonate transport system transcriptional regulator